MTIALGLLTTDGVVIGADTEETAGANKLAVSKLRSATRDAWINDGQRMPGCVCTVSGAGDGEYIDAVSDALLEAFINAVADPDLTTDALEAVLTTVYRDFYKETVIPFAAYPEDQRPSVSLVIGAQFNGKSAIWTTDRLAVLRVHELIGFGAVGFGNPTARSLLGRLYRHADHTAAILLAIYVLMETKTWVPYCGKDSQIICMRGGRLWPVLPEDIKRVEELFYGENSLEAIEQRMLHHCFGTSGYDDPGNQMRIQGELRQKFTAITERWNWRA